jgi:hypothetical protein
VSEQRAHPLGVRDRAQLLEGAPGRLQLEPGGVLVTWNASSPPALALGPGSRIRVDGREARRVDTAGGMCSRIGADRTIDVLIATRPLPSTPTQFTACLRRPGLAQEQKSVDALLASTKFAS